MCWILQGLSNTKGKTVAAQTLRGNHQVKSNLEHDSLVYIKLVGIVVAFQGQGLSRHMFDLYYECLRTLPECESSLSFFFLTLLLTHYGTVYACSENTMLVLQPGHPGDTPYTPQAYNNMTLGQIQTQLLLVYEALGFQMIRDVQQPYIGPLRVPGGPNIVIMGRQL